MCSSLWRRLWATPGATVFIPALAAARSFDPVAIIELPGYYLAAGSFVLVLVFSAAIRLRYGGYVDDSVETSMERPHVSVLYGFIAFGLVGFLGGLGLSQLVQFGITSRKVGIIAAIIIAVAVLLLVGLGYAVVGAWVTGLWDTQRTWDGLVCGAGLSAVGWLVLPPLAGALAWFALGAVGVGGPMRVWMHSERSVEIERKG